MAFFLTGQKLISLRNKFQAEGTAELPITFTSVLPDRHLPQRGAWGGLIICGGAPVAAPFAAGNGGSDGDDRGSGSGSDARLEHIVEGTNDVPYGGNNVSDSSGVLRYVRVWYSGRILFGGNEINGQVLVVQCPMSQLLKHT